MFGCVWSSLILANFEPILANILPEFFDKIKAGELTLNFRTPWNLSDSPWVRDNFMWREGLDCSENSWEDFGGFFAIGRL